MARQPSHSGVRVCWAGRSWQRTALAAGRHDLAWQHATGRGKPLPALHTPAGVSSPAALPARLLAACPKRGRPIAPPLAATAEDGRPTAPCLPVQVGWFMAAYTARQGLLEQLGHGTEAR